MDHWGAGFPYELPEDFEFSSRLVDGNFGAVFKQKSEHYKIKFYREAQMVVKERKWAENQIIKEEGIKTIIEFDSTKFLKIKAWVLSNGCNAKPLEPEWLVKEWINMLLKWLKWQRKYKKFQIYSFFTKSMLLYS